MEKGEFIPFPLDYASLTQRRLTGKKECKLLHFADCISKIRLGRIFLNSLFPIWKAFFPSLEMNNQIINSI